MNLTEGRADDTESIQNNDQVVDESDVKKAVTAAAMGNALEWFDFGVYGFMAGTLGDVFFPSSNSASSLLLTFGVFALSFAVRPLEGVYKNNV